MYILIMNNKKDYYIYKIDKKKHKEYVKKYNDKHKADRHKKYLEFRNEQLRYYYLNEHNGASIPYKYLKQKDKELYNKTHSKKGILSFLKGGK